MLLNRVLIKGEYLDVGSGKYLSAANQTAIILIFKNLGIWYDGLLCLFWAWFLLRNFGLFVVIVLVIDFRLIDEIVCRVCFDGLFERFFD